jgi:hypothetical protein
MARRLSREAMTNFPENDAFKAGSFKIRVGMTQQQRLVMHFMSV